MNERFSVRVAMGQLGAVRIARNVTLGEIGWSFVGAAGAFGAFGVMWLLAVLGSK